MRAATVPFFDSIVDQAAEPGVEQTESIFNRKERAVRMASSEVSEDPASGAHLVTSNSAPLMSADRQEPSLELTPAPPKCYICGERFGGGLPELDRHLEQRHAADLVPYRCAACGVDGFVPIRSMRAINKHFALHDVQERPHRCSHCALRFRTERNLHSHVRLVHRPEPMAPRSSGPRCQPPDGVRRFQCRHCGSSYSSPSARKRHENTHTLRVRYRCAQCAKEFAKLDCLTQHERIHSQTRPYACDQCASRFIQLAHLRIHKRARHSGERPHVCAICNRGFRCRTGLKVHGRIHTGEKPFRCADCGLTFGDAGTLRKHGAVHRSGRTTDKDGRANEGRRMAISTGRG